MKEGRGGRIEMRRAREELEQGGYILALALLFEYE
jgi:hypothetical protein